MRDNLAELNSRQLAKRWPVLLGGAALTRAYVEQDLAAVFEGEVRYARDAFEGLRLMDAAMAVKRGDPGAKLPDLRVRRVAARPSAAAGEGETGQERGARSGEVSLENPVPEPPFWGTRVVKGLQLAEYASYLDERATFMGQWGLKPSRKPGGPSYEELVESEGLLKLVHAALAVNEDFENADADRVREGLEELRFEGLELLRAARGPLHGLFLI